MRRISLAVCVAALALLTACHTDGNPFYKGSAWNRTLNGWGVADPNSGTYVNQLRGGPSVLDTREYGVPVFEGSSPRKTADCTASWCQYDGIQVTVPDGAHPASGTDAAMSVWDQSRGLVYDWWQVQSIGSTVIRSTDVSQSCTDFENAACDGNGVTTTGAGVSRLAGVFTESDFNSGHIPHALVFSSYTVNDNQGECLFRYPASKTDACGQSQRVSLPLPEGAVLQLDPAFNVDGLNIADWNKAMLFALQEHGAVCIDSGGAAAAWVADEIPVADYAGVYVPWDRVRVLRNWQGT